MQRYQRKVYAVAFGFLRNQEDALDVVQESFIKVHRYIGKFEGNSTFYTWLYRIVANLCIDQSGTLSETKVSGSATLVRSLLEKGLLDELRLLVHPVVVGSGAKLFENDVAPVSLKLAGSRAFATGVVDLTYQPAAA